MIIFDKGLLDGLSREASGNARLRKNFDLRNSEGDGSQRMLNALEMGTVLPIHRHRGTSETVIVIRGSVRELFYDAQGRLTESYVLRAGGELSGLNIPAGQWHSLECLEKGTVLFEAKDGAWEALGEEDILSC